MACCNNLALVLDKLQRTFGAHTTEMVQDMSKKLLADLKISTPTCSFLDAIYGPLSLRSFSIVMPGIATAS
jgi:hypothetical protein